MSCYAPELQIGPDVIVDIAGPEYVKFFAGAPRPPAPDTTLAAIDGASRNGTAHRKMTVPKATMYLTSSGQTYSKAANEFEVEIRASGQRPVSGCAIIVRWC